MIWTGESLDISPAVWFPTVRAGTGVDVFTARLVEGLRGRGIHAEICWLPKRAEYLPWTVRRSRPPRWANIVQVNTWLHSRFLETTLPIVATMHLCVHDPALAKYRSQAQARYHSLWVRPTESSVLNRASRVVAVSAYAAERTKEAFGITDVGVIHNGTHIPSQEKYRAKKVRKRFRLLYVGNWSARKGTDLLGPIMARLGAGFELWYTADARGAHRRSHLPANCRCIGRLEPSQLGDFYSSADALIFPSRLEGFGLVAIEAMARGVPVIAGYSGPIQEIIDDGVTGILCANDDIGHYVSAVRWLAENPEGRQAMGKAAFDKARQQFDVELMVDRYLNTYRSILSTKVGRPAPSGQA